MAIWLTSMKESIVCNADMWETQLRPVFTSVGWTRTRIQILEASFELMIVCTCPETVQFLLKSNSQSIFTNAFVRFRIDHSSLGTRSGPSKIQTFTDSTPPVASKYQLEHQKHRYKRSQHHGMCHYVMDIEKHRLAKVFCFWFAKQ